MRFRDFLDSTFGKLIWKHAVVSKIIFFAPKELYTIGLKQGRNTILIHAYFIKRQYGTSYKKTGLNILPIGFGIFGLLMHV